MRLGALLLALCCLWLAFVMPEVANAATYSNNCPTPVGTDYLCDALTERLEAQTALLEQIEANTEGDGPAEVSGTVALSSADRERLDLGWWGSWAIVGILLVLIIAPMFLRVFRTDAGL